jgi:hypothetical protein
VLCSAWPRPSSRPGQAPSRPSQAGPKPSQALTIGPGSAIWKPKPGREATAWYLNPGCICGAVREILQRWVHAQTQSFVFVLTVCTYLLWPWTPRLSTTDAHAVQTRHPAVWPMPTMWQILSCRLIALLALLYPRPQLNRPNHQIKTHWSHQHPPALLHLHNQLNMKISQPENALPQARASPTTRTWAPQRRQTMNSPNNLRRRGEGGV